MGKSEFLSILRITLTGEVPEHEIQSNLRYYEEYISANGHTEKGESEVIEQIGDPRLIARTIIEAYEAGKGPMGEQSHNSQYYDEYEEEKDYEQKPRGFRVEFGTGKQVPLLTKIKIGILIAVIISIIILIIYFATTIAFFYPVY